MCVPCSGGGGIKDDKSVVNKLPCLRESILGSRARSTGTVVETAPMSTGKKTIIIIIITNNRTAMETAPMSTSKYVFSTAPKVLSIVPLHIE